MVTSSHSRRWLARGSALADPRRWVRRVWGAVAPLSLVRRIVASVALGLALILLLFGLVSLWTIQETTEAAYHERVALAQALVWHVDAVLGYARATLDREAREIRLDPGRPLAADEARQLEQLRLQVGSFAIISVVDRTGRALWADPARADVRIGNPVLHPSVQLALRTGQPQMTEYTPPGRAVQTYACLAVPLHDAAGQLSGVLMAELDPSQPTLNLLPTSEVGEAMRVYLANPAGHVLAGSEGARMQGGQSHQTLLADLIATHTAGYRIHQPASGSAQDSHIVAYAPVTLLPEWGIIVEQPRDVVLAMPRELELRLTVVGVIALLVAGAVAWFDVRRVVHPLRRLTASARRFAAGNLDDPVALDRTDELGILAHAFETMRQRLRSSLAEVAEWNRELERRVAARTTEVERLYRSLQARERERAELLQRIMAGQEEERRRLAQELHDETSQALASLQLGLERLADEMEPAEARHLASQLQEVATETLDAVHRLSVELRPSVLDDVGLVAAIERYLQEYPRRWGLAVDFAAVGVDGFRLIPAAETAVYRIVQAATTNVVQHAHAQHLSVLLQRRDDCFVVVVEDDGQGFDLGTVRTAGLENRLGLAGMEERATLIGATMTIESTPGVGTTVFLEVPLDSNCPPEEEARAQAAARAG